MNAVTPIKGSSARPRLPLVRLELFLPFVQELDQRRLDADSLLRQHGLVRASVNDPNLFISVNVIHKMLEDCAGISGDPYFALHVGEQLDVSRWSPLIDAATRASSLGDFLTRFILAATEDASSVTQALEVKGVYTFFREQRISEPTVTPSQNDAFTAAYMLSILKNAAGAHWDARAVLLQVSDPDALPKGYQGIQIAGGDNRGMSVRFPTEWLTYDIERQGFISPASFPANRTHPPGSFLEALWLTLSPRLGSDELSVDHVAHLLGLGRQTLQRRLKTYDTSLTKELMQLKQQHAIEALVHTGQAVAEIGESLGFQSPASFTRAFKSWTGQSPRDYRKAHRRDVS
jgi:AraC-like DNA-binding protein